jgi:Flp pilus assembly protein TadD
MARTYASKSALSEAIALINSGRPDKAEAICRSAVERNPDDINMVALLGAILLKGKRTAAA